VFSCFACGGGSTMGYKLAGCEVLGCVEIDKRMNDVYVKNHNPKYNYLMDIRKFNEIPNEELPEELFNLDILDGSPPCTTFSMAGLREESWGKKKKFREGQTEQTLDDLSFIFIDTVAKLRPKVVIMENVEGLIKGEAWSYVQRIYKHLNEIGYKVKHWLLKGQYMVVPQKRHRIFFVALREDVQYDLMDLDMSFNYEPVLFGEIKEGVGEQLTESGKYILDNATKNDKSFADVLIRLENRNSRFNEMIVWDDDVCPTIHNHGHYRGNDKCKFTLEDYRNAQTFPLDYIFESKAQAAYVCGMSVPPLMIKRIVTRLIESGVFDYKLRKDG
jgi:DNA (cytosine-5)-methyltransferase 1